MNIKWTALPPLGQNQASDWLEDATPEQIQALETTKGLLVPLMFHAPFLATCAQKNLQFLVDLVQNGPEQLMETELAEIDKIGQTAASFEEISKRLRQSKSKVALLVAVAEVGKIWTSARATKALSDLADHSLHAALNFLIKDATDSGKFIVDAHKQYSAGNCGLTILALGKHGGQELNYSSDIDIVAFYDPQNCPVSDSANLGRFYARLVQKLATLMEERTEFGYVFRTDLRLRPDPGSTPVALSVDAALNYYESRGQNWERAAWIKARHCAGDARVGNKFLRDISPFVWRKHLDFATISDIQAMKRQINIARNVGDMRVLGHNVKLGRGGIREIEFFAQTQQLIAGGREPDLQVRPTSEALASLAAAGWISMETCAQLQTAYWYLRAVENRLQMIADEQTHILPDSAAQLSTIAALMNVAKLAEFEADYVDTLAKVTDNYVSLFEQEHTLSSPGGNLVFTGTDDDPETLKTLTQMGFADAQHAASTIKKWHYGGYRATRAAASRARLTELVPLLLETMARAGNADEALARFDNFLSRLPSGVQLFTLLLAHENLRELLVAFMGSAPKMADAVQRRVHVMDGLIDPFRANELVDPDALRDKINAFLDQGNSFEDLIDRARIIGQEQMFLISAGLISGTISTRRTSKQFTVLAQTLLTRLFNDVRENFAERHGQVPGARVALLAFGKLGSSEMTASSDLDIVLLYDAPPGSTHSNGPKSLPTPQYFTRLTQRMIASLSAPTATGVLYEVDMRLRPSGNAGPVATSFAAFQSYQRDKAWTWEHLALTRARVVCADDEFGAEIDNFILSVLDVVGQENTVVKDVLEMRARLLKERPGRNVFDLKLVEGGLIDLEFIAQSATLLHMKEFASHRGDTPDILIQLAETGLLPQGRELATIHQTMSAIVNVLSACLLQPLKLDEWTAGFKKLLTRLTNQPDLQHLEAELVEMTEKVRLASRAWFEGQKN